MATFTEFSKNSIRDILTVTDTTFFRLMEEAINPMSRFFPSEFYEDENELMLEISTRKGLGRLLAPDQEIPSSRPNLEAVIRSTIGTYSGIRYDWREADYRLLEKIENFRTQPNGAEIAEKLTRGLLGVFANLIPSIEQRSLHLMLLLNSTGNLTYTDPITRLQLNVSYPVTAGHVPAALTGGTRWNQPTTCDPLGNLETHANTLYATLGMYPFALLIHKNNIDQMRSCNSVRIAAQIKRSGEPTIDQVPNIFIDNPTINPTSKVATGEIIDLIKGRTNCQEVLIFDTEFSEEQPDNTFVNVPFLPADTYQFVWERTGIRAFFPVKGADGQLVRGIATVTKDNGTLPFAEHTAALGKFGLANGDPRKIAARRVN
jgi:hypothetical protein